MCQTIELSIIKTKSIELSGNLLMTSKQSSLIIWFKGSILITILHYPKVGENSLIIHLTYFPNFRCAIFDKARFFHIYIKAFRYFIFIGFTHFNLNLLSYQTNRSLNFHHNNQPQYSLKLYQALNY